MNERRADIVLATLIALTFAAIAVKGVAVLRSFDPRSGQSEARLLPDLYIDSGEPQGAVACALPWGATGALTEFVEAALQVAVCLCFGCAFICLWVVSIHRRNMKSNPPRAPASSTFCGQAAVSAPAFAAYWVAA